VLSVWSLPFMGDLFTYKSQMLIYQNVMGDDTLLQKLNADKATELHSQLERNKLRFQELPGQQKEKILKEYTHLQTLVTTTFMTKLGQSFRILLWDIPPFELAWIVFSLVISILLLKRYEGAAQAAWLLPLITFLYAYSNITQGKNLEALSDAQLFPSESVIINDYLKKPLSPSIQEQQKQLMYGWQLYLIKVWAHEDPSMDPSVFQKQVEQGEYAFNVARLDKIASNPLLDHAYVLNKKEPKIFLLIYLLWNLAFAWRVNKWIQHKDTKALRHKENELII